VREELGELRAEIKSLQKTMDARFDAQQQYMDARFDDITRTMQIGFGMTGGVLVALIGLIATQL